MDYRDDKVELNLFCSAKDILNGKKEYKKTLLHLISFVKEDHLQIIEIENEEGFRPIEYVDTSEWKEYVKTEESLLSDVPTVEMLIINCDEVHSMVLEGSSVKGLLLGPKVCKLSNDYLWQKLKYLYVDERNPYFRAEENVLFSHDKSILYTYASQKPDMEYHVEKSVQMIASKAFHHAKNLHKVYLPKSVKVAKDAFDLKKKVLIEYYE